MVFMFMQMSQGCSKCGLLEEGGLNVGVVAGDTQRVMKEKEEGLSRGWDELLGRVKECTEAEMPKLVQ